MWKNPEINKPNFENIAMEEMNEEEQANVNGESVGTCYVIGYSCWSYGGFGVGVCYIGGYSCWSRGN